MRVPCPCCGYLTLTERSCWDVCQVCYWEDDGQGDANADVESGGPNHVSLTTARQNFKTFGASERRFVQFTAVHSRRASFGRRGPSAARCASYAAATRAASASGISPPCHARVKNLTSPPPFLPFCPNGVKPPSLRARDPDKRLNGLRSACV